MSWNRLIVAGTVSGVNCISISSRDPVSAMAAAAQVMAAGSESAVHARTVMISSIICATAIKPVLVLSHVVPAEASAEGVGGVESSASDVVGGTSFRKVLSDPVSQSTRVRRGPLCPAFCS